MADIDAWDLLIGFFLTMLVMAMMAIPFVHLKVGP